MMQIHGSNKALRDASIARRVTLPFVSFSFSFHFPLHSTTMSATFCTLSVNIYLSLSVLGSVKLSVNSKTVEDTLKREQY